jgi:hypothetical protein
VDNYGITSQEILLGDHFWRSIGYLRISSDIELGYVFQEISRRDTIMILNLQISPRISHHIPTSPKISEDIPWGELPDGADQCAISTLQCGISTGSAEGLGQALRQGTPSAKAGCAERQGRQGTPRAEAGRSL